MDHEERYVESGDSGDSGGLTLWAERIGEAGDPAVLLVMGTSAQGIMWPDELVEHIVDAGFAAIRFDHRDTGRSDCVDFAANPYTVADMAGDCLAVLDGFGIGAAHLVGISLGGTIAQWLAVHRPDRVRSLTAIATSPMGHDRGPAWHRVLTGQQPDPDDLPGPVDRFVRHIAERAAKPPSTPAEQEASAVETWRVLNGDVLPFDEQAALESVRLSGERAHTPEAADQHDLAGREITPDRLVPLDTIGVPTLVIHGTEDPIFPPGHGEALAARIPDARLEIVPGMGHFFFSPGLPKRVATLIVSHLAP